MSFLPFFLSLHCLHLLHTRVKRLLERRRALRKVVGLSLDLVLGIGAERLRNEDYRADECRAVGYSLMELKSAGFAVAELKDAAYAASELRLVGFSATALATAGFTPRELIQGSYPLSVLNAELHCSVSDLKSQGFGVGELKVRDECCGCGG